MESSLLVRKEITIELEKFEILIHTTVSGRETQVLNELFISIDRNLVSQIERLFKANQIAARHA